MDRRLFGASLVLGAAATTARAAPSPTCGPPHAGGLSEADFRDYIAKFNARNYAGFSAYYAPDVNFQGQAAKVVGRQAVVDFYAEAWKHIGEKITLGAVIVSPQGIAAELTTTITAFEDYVLRSGPMKKGDSHSTLVFAFYDVRDRHFVRIRTARVQRL